MLYLVLKSLHIVSVIAWMAGMLYLPRLFVYHADTEPGSKQSETFKVMERRLMRAIINPAMAATWIFGLSIAYLQGYWLQGWFILKLALVLALSALHGALSGALRSASADAPAPPARGWRVAPLLALGAIVAVVWLALLKPF